MACNRLIEAITAVHTGDQGIQGGVVGQLQPEGVEPLAAQPQFMFACPGLPAVIDDSLTPKQFRDSVPHRHQIAPAIVAGTHQIPSSLLGGAGDRDLHDLSKMEQPGQMCGVTGIGLDPITRGALQLRRGSHPAIDTGRDQCPRQPETGRACLIGHRHRRR
jgi:hypothetical protein